MSTLLFLFVAESFVFGWMWHNQSLRSERDSEGPDPAVLFAHGSKNPQTPAPSVEVESTFQTIFQNKL